MFALLDDEIVEGANRDGRLRELRRVSYGPHIREITNTGDQLSFCWILASFRPLIITENATTERRESIDLLCRAGLLSHHSLCADDRIRTCQGGLL